MKEQNISNGGNAPKIVDYFVVALYDPGTRSYPACAYRNRIWGGHRVDEREAIHVPRTKLPRLVDTSYLKFKVSKSAEAWSPTASDRSQNQ